MSGTVQRATEKALTKRYEALLRLSQTLISIRSSQELFNILAHELRAVVNFYVMSVGIYDEHAHEVRLTSYGEPGDPLQVPKLAPEETFSWWGVPASAALDHSFSGRGDSIPSCGRDAQDSRRSFGMRASVDGSTPTPGGPNLGLYPDSVCP